MKLSSRGIAITFIIVCLPGLYAGHYGITTIIEGIRPESRLRPVGWLVIAFILVGYLLYAGYIWIAMGRPRRALARAIWSGTIWYNAACFLGAAGSHYFFHTIPPLVAAIWSIAAIVLAFRARQDLLVAHPISVNAEATSAADLSSPIADPSTPQPEQP